MVLVLAVCTALYWPALHGPFLFDDFPNLAALTSIDHVSSWRDLGIYLSQPRSFPGRPLAMLSFLLQKSAWPDHPFPFRLVNIGLHLLNGVLVFLLVLRLARTYLADQADERRAWLAANLATAAWLLDPIQISGVLLVVQRMTLLMAFFVLLGLQAYLRALLETNAQDWRRGIWMMLGLGACTGLAFLSKENGILLPLYALALDATVLRQAVRRLPSRLSWLRRLLIWPVVLFVLGYLLWQIPVQWGVHGFRDFTLGERLLTEPRALASYLDKSFVPRFGLYGLYHDSFVVSQGWFNPWTTGPCLLALLAALVVAVVGTRRWPLLSLGILWYLGGQLLESSTVMLELYFEHRNYLPLMGVMAALAIGIARETPQRRRLYLLVCGLWLMACCLTTALSARVYSSAERLAATWAHNQPDSIRAQSFLAQQLLQHGMVDQSLQVIDAIDVRHPANAGLAENRLYLLCMQGRLTAADVQRMDDILRIAPFDRSGFENMSTLRELAANGRCPAFDDQAWLHSADILLGNPAYRNDGLAAGFLHYQKHFWAVAHGRLDMTIQELDETYRNDPDAEIPRLRAKYLASASLYGQAISTLRSADYSRLPLLRRLLVDDRAIDAAAIVEIEKMRNPGAPAASKSQ
ncbi:hypothetical protein [Dyella choica]|uniref:Tetratricopeptide repeat protein n=1 Tax=Dyella choica TaxID=1927959 RepID=A0A3S0PN41_9GAMM|nr:hypothetical protein [Dyella choica]RUL76760.1 hypothetical protein EKH80_08595 [Dyella choica]